MKAKSYWNENLDTDNLSRKEGAEHGELERSLTFCRSPEFDWALQRAGNLEGKTWMDLGGGLGLHGILLARRGARVIVTDMAVERLKALKKIAHQAGVAERMRFVAGQAEALPFQENSLDGGHTKSVLIHTELPAALREWRRVLKPGGRAWFIEPLNGNPLIRLYRNTLAPKIWKSITRYFDRASIEEVRRGFGGLIRKHFYLTGACAFFWQYMCPSVKLWKRTLHWTSRLDRLLLRYFPGWGLACWFIVLEVEKKAPEDKRTPS